MLSLQTSEAAVIRHECSSAVGHLHACVDSISKMCILQQSLLKHGEVTERSSGRYSLRVQQCCWSSQLRFYWLYASAPFGVLTGSHWGMTHGRAGATVPGLSPLTPRRASLWTRTWPSASSLSATRSSITMMAWKRCAGHVCARVARERDRGGGRERERERERS